jgi:hypothetical protein
MTNPTKLLTLGCAALTGALLACAAGAGASRGGATASGTSSGSGGGAAGSGGSMPDGGPSDAPLVFTDVVLSDSPAETCSPNEVYMLTWSNNLYRFDPGTLAFTKIANLSCLPSSFSAFSMAVDRNGTAWIEGWVASPTIQWFLHEVSTSDGSCTGSLTLPGSHNFETAGGGETYVADIANGPAETLYSAAFAGTAGGGSQFRLSTIDTTSGVVTLGGTLNTDPSSGVALTGTGDARLFAAESPVTSTDAGTNIVFTQRDPGTAAVLSTANVMIPPSYVVISMVFWGGDFWFFLRPTSTGPWMVGRYRTSDMSFTVEVPDVAQATGEQGLGITAVGISICAPLTPPK